MSAHTPGPWSIPHFAEPDTNFECGYVLCDHLMGAVATVHCSGEGQDWQRHGDNPKFAEACANARLIAAAPKMLAALRECTDDLAAMVDHQYKGMRDHPRYQRDMRPVYAARHVIAKAEPTRSVGAAQTITASCGHEITKVSDGVAVEYDDEDNGPEPGFEPCTVYATYCPKCAVEGAKAGNIRIITAD